MINLLCAVNVTTILIIISALSLLVSLASLIKIHSLSSNQQTNLIQNNANLLTAPANDTEDSQRVVAAITAAIACYYRNNGTSKSCLTFRVRSIKEIK